MNFAVKIDMIAILARKLLCYITKFVMRKGKNIFGVKIDIMILLQKDKNWEKERVSNQVKKKVGKLSK